MKKWILLLITANLIFQVRAQNVGISTNNPTSKFQIHSTATFGRPTIRLVDSAAGSGPIVEFRNSGGTNNYQMGAAINNADPAQSFFGIYQNSGPSIFSMKGNGRVGFGTMNPRWTIHLHADGPNLLDHNAFALFTRKGSAWCRHNRILENSQFMDEAHSISRLSRLYCIDGWRDARSAVDQTNE